MAMASSAGSDLKGAYCLWAQFPFAVAAYAASGQPGADTPYIPPWRLEGIIPDAYGRLIGYPRRHISAPVVDPYPKGTVTYFVANSASILSSRSSPDINLGNRVSLIFSKVVRSIVFSFILWR